MACGFGLCFTCTVPVIRKDGSGYDNLRACIEGPVFNPARILWDRWMGEEPHDAADAARGASRWCAVAGVKRTLAVDLGGRARLPTPGAGRRRGASGPAASSPGSSTCASWAAW